MNEESSIILHSNEGKITLKSEDKLMQENCTFVPKISQSSTNIVLKRRSTSPQKIDIFQRLHSNAASKKCPEHENSCVSECKKKENSKLNKTIFTPRMNINLIPFISQFK